MNTYIWTLSEKIEMKNVIVGTNIKKTQSEINLPKNVATSLKCISNNVAKISKKFKW